MQEPSDNEPEPILPEDQQQEQPELYSKMLILIFAILFSTIFAAALLVVNLRSLGKNKEAVWILVFAIGYVIATAIVFHVLKVDPGFTPIANVVGAAILNEFFWNKYIGSDFVFRKKSWIKPALISILIALAFFLVLMVTM